MYESHRKSYNYKEFESQFTTVVKEQDIQKKEEMQWREEEKLARF